MDSSTTPTDRTALPFPVGDGEMAARVRAFDWSATDIGPIGVWPQSLKTAVELMLATPLPTVMLWGAEGVMIYNDGYAAFAGARHPASLGSKVDTHWPEVADFNRRVIDRVLAGRTITLEDENVVLHRNGVAEDAWMNLNYVPVRDERGCPVAVLATVVETTKQRLAERRTKATEEQFQTLANSIPTLCWMADKTGWIFWYNQRWYEYGGVTPKEMEGWGWQSMHHPDTLPAVKERWSASIQSGEPFEMVFPLKAADGQFRPFLTRVTPVRDEDGVVVRWFGTNTDITRQLETEELLRKSEEQFRTLAEAIPNHAWAGEPDGMLNWFNRRVYDYTGAAPGELDGEKWAVVVHPEDLDRTGAVWAKSLADGSPYETEFRLRRADGVYRWYLARAMPVRDDAGRIVRWIGTNTDITRQREIEEAQRALNQTLEQRVAERTADRDRMWRLSQDLMIVVSDADEVVIDAVNPAWQRILGWTEAELVGHSAVDFVHPDDISLAQADRRPYVEEVSPDGRAIRRYENRYRHKQGGWRWISWTVVAADGILQGVGRDVTGEKERAEVLALTEAQLRQAQKMEAVGQLTGGIAHDFNNMLAIVISSLGLLKRRLSKGDTNVERFADSALDGANRAASLTHRLLAFSRQQPLKPEAIDPGRLVSGLSEMLTRTLGETIRTETVFGAGLWRTHTDPHQLESAILNLAVNARDAMADGGKLTIETANADLDERYTALYPGLAPGQYVIIAVTDTGAGMDADTVAKAFDPFFTTKAVGKGTGLGLSQVYGFVRQSGGHVKIYSEIGQGTTVKLYLPRFIGDHETAPDPVAKPLPYADEAVTILLVEDEPAVRQLGLEALTELGYRVLEADCAATALRLLDAHPEVALLFTDVVMPEINGRKLAEEATRRRPDLKVLFTTGYTRNAVVHNGVLDPGVELLGKPFTIEQLGAKLRAILDA